jgi:hypothetical protein
MTPDRPITNRSPLWLREIADMEHDATYDSITDEPSAYECAAPVCAYPIPLTALEPPRATQEAAAAVPHHDAGQVGGVAAVRAVSPFAALMLGDCEVCE